MLKGGRRILEKVTCRGMLREVYAGWYTKGLYAFCMSSPPPKKKTPPPVETPSVGIDIAITFRGKLRRCGGLRGERRRSASGFTRRFPLAKFISFSPNVSHQSPARRCARCVKTHTDTRRPYKKKPSEKVGHLKS